jgi:uncharacterized protein YqhQ
MANVGGQAVLEGVMMRGASNWAVAVRKPDGDIAEVHQSIKSPMARHRIFRLPVIRGVVALGESRGGGVRPRAGAGADTPPAGGAGGGGGGGGWPPRTPPPPN